MTVSVVDDASKQGPAVDDSIIEDVTAGTFDMAVVPTRAWGANGVDSMKVLQTPFEIASNEHMAAIARDTSLLDPLFKDLVARNLHGLAIFPEELRFMFSFGKPIVAPADLSGMTIRSLTSDVDPAIAALGGKKTVNPGNEALGEGVADGTIGADEFSLARAAGNSFYVRSTVTADLPLYAKFVSLVAGGKFWNGLGESQRSVLTKAADAMRDQAILDLPSTAESARRFCAGGGSVVLAGAEALDAFRAAVAPALTALDANLLAEIRSLAPATVAAGAVPCEGGAGAFDPGDVVADGGDLPNGVYRVQLTQHFAEEWNKAPGHIRFRPSDTFPQTFTWTLKDGHYRFELVIGDAPPGTDSGVYQVIGDEVLIALSPDSGNVANRLRWSVGADGSLTLEQIDDLDKDPNYALVWTRIGDAH